MATNAYLPFATAGGANVLDSASYSALAARLSGFTAGVAQSQQLNTVWRQSSVVSAMIGQFIADNSGQSANDDGNVATLETNFTKAIAYPVQNNAWTAAGDTGAANAYAVALSPAPTAYATYMELSFKPANNNTGAATLNVNGLGTKSILRSGGAALQAGDIQTGQVVKVAYDGTAFQLRSNGSVSVPGNMQVFSTPGTTNFTVPAGITRIRAKVWAAGGGGGGSNSSTAAAAAGGGGGGYAEGSYAVTPGAVIAVTVGAGGTAGATTPSSGGAGGSSSFGSFASATGGGGGGGPGGSGGGSGSGTGGQINVNGGSAGTGQTYVAGTAYGGGFGGAGYGFSNNGPNIQAGGIGGGFPGCGANGSSANAAGGVGANGQVILEW